MVAFMLPCICWPEAFMLMWVEMNMVTMARMGRISRGRLSAERLY